MTLIVETDEAYHSAEGVSKSGLFRLLTKSPFHFKYVPYESKPEFDIGKAAHIAILEPNEFEHRVAKGPEDRRGNKWKDFTDFTNHAQVIGLTAGDYDMACRIRDLAGTVQELVDIQKAGDAIVETSAYHIDEETGVLTKSRLDIYSPSVKAALDIKNMADASPTAFAKAVASYGYHMQESMYSDVWTKGGGGEIDVFAFVVFEKSEPPIVQLYELDAPTIAEGHAMYRAGVKKYAECAKAGEWPAYGEGIQRVGLARRWDYRYTTPPEGE